MSTSPHEPGTEPQQDDSESPADQQLDDPQPDQDSEPPLSAPGGPDGTADDSGEQGQEGLAAGTHGSARRPPADS